MKIYKRNNVVYFYGYFVAQLVFIYINVFLPVYFFNILKVNRTELAFVQMFSYTALLIKPLIAIYFDKVKSTRKLFIIVSSFGILVSFIFFIFSLSILIIFGIFLGINFAFITILDVAIDKIIIETSTDEKTKDRYALYTRLGAFFGALIPNFIFFLIFKDLYSIPTWNLFFITGTLLILPLIVISFFLYDKSEIQIQAEDINEKNVRVKLIIIMCLALFLIYADKLFEYPLEPWILSHYGEENFLIFTFFLVILVLINALGLIIAGFISNKFNRIKILSISIIFYGILLIIAPFTDIFTFFIILGIIQILILVFLS